MDIVTSIWPEGGQKNILEPANGYFYPQLKSFDTLLMALLVAFHGKNA